jgi:hypothetical protein
MKLNGNGHEMANTLLKVHIRYNSWEDIKKPAFNPIWKARAERKCKIFAWILLQHKILTANNLAKRNWPHDQICPLCKSAPETPTHLCFDCPFTRDVWTQLTTQLGRVDLRATSPQTINGWWKQLRRNFDKKQKPAFDGLILYFWWNIWKERNKRIFQHTSLEVAQVALLIANDTETYQEVTTPAIPRQQIASSASGNH